MSGYSFSRRSLAAIGAFAFTIATGQLNAQDNSVAATHAGLVTNAKGITVLHVQKTESVDFVHAKAKPLPINPLVKDSTQALMQALASVPDLGPSGSSPAAVGNGKTNPAFLGKPEVAEKSELSGITPEDFGTNNHPFTTARAGLYNETTNTVYPYRPAGKLFFNISGSTYLCSASMIKRGIVVTAAHCVANYGQSQFYSGWQFVPGYLNGSAPFGVWTVSEAWILTSYYNGTDGCAVSGVVCPDDVAVLLLNPQSGNYVGTYTGWYGYFYGGAGFTPNGLVQVTQLGYPVGLDNGLLMERNDSQGYTNSGDSNNTVIGSNMNGGSSGGPWLVNFGKAYTLTGETNGSGYTSLPAIIGVTSWGYTSTGPKEQGAAPFTYGNIQTLLNVACGAVPAACS